MWKVVVALVGALYVGYQFVDRTDLKQVNNKRVIVTGASKGIGEQVAHNYARLGANVVLVARSEDKLKKVVAQCKKVAPEGRMFDYIAADLSDLNATEKVVKDAIDLLGGLDYLVLNHVGISKKGYWLASADQYDMLHRSYDLNFFSYVYMASHALQALEKSAGSIVVVGSVSGKIGSPTTAMYSAEKFALDGFFSAWRNELAMRRVPVSITYCVLGLIGTETGRKAMSNTRGHHEGRLSYADPSETALDVIKGGLRRSREVYTPYFPTALTICFRDMISGLFDKGIQEVLEPVD